MKAKIGLTHFWVLLLIFLLNGCMPDSMTKWEENPPKKDEAPVVVYDPPANYSYSVALGGQTSKIFDINKTITPLAPNENFTGEEVTFSVDPALPKGLSLNASTGVISGTPTQETGAQDYTFTATNTGGTSTTTINFDVVTPTTLSGLTYPQLDESVNYIKLNEELDTVGPTLEEGTSSSWSIAPNNGSVGTCIAPKVQILAGVCFDTTSGVITGTPTATMLDSVTFTVTASKTDPVSTASVSFNLQVLEAPAGLSYEQSSLLKITLNSSDPSLVYDRYIKLINAGGTSCTLAYIEDTDGNSLLIRKHDPSYTYSLGDYVTAVAPQLTDPTSLTCVLANNSDLDTPSNIGNIPISAIANVFQKGEQFELNPTLTSGSPTEDKVSFSISSSTFSVAINAAQDGYTLPGDLEEFKVSTGALKGSLDENFEPTEFTITATNGVGSTTYVLKVSPIVQIPKYLNYSQQVIMRVTDASAFQVGEEISSIDYIDPVTTEEFFAGRGKVLSVEMDPVTFSEIMVVNVDENLFLKGLPVDDRFPYKSEESSIGGYTKLTVANASSFTPGEYITSENAAFGIIYATTATSISVNVLNGQFVKGENIDDAYPYVAAETSIIEATDDGVLDGHTAILTVITNLDGGDDLSTMDLPTSGKEIAVGANNSGQITYVPHSNTAVITVGDVTGADVGDSISTSNTQADGGTEHENIATIARAAGTNTIYLTGLTEPIQVNEYISYTNTFTGVGAGFQISSAINNRFVARVNIASTDIEEYTVGGYVSINRAATNYNNVGQVYHIDRSANQIYLKNLGVKLTNGDSISPGTSYDPALASAITADANVRYGYRLYFKQTKGSFSLGDTITTSGATSGDIAVIEGAVYRSVISENSSGITIKKGLSIAEAKPVTDLSGQTILLTVPDASAFTAGEFITSNPGGGAGRVISSDGLTQIHVRVTSNGFTAADSIDDASPYVGAETTITTITDPNITGEINGYINEYNAITGFSYISIDTTTPYENMGFDYLNPINRFRSSYPRLTSLSTTPTFFLRKGVPVVLAHAVDRNISAAFSITPPLPEGLSLDQETGKISGTPTKASTFKSYTVEAVNSSFPDDPVFFTFNLKIDEFFELTVKENGDNGSAAYILHRIGKNNNSRACRVTKDQIDTNNYEDIDVVCRLEGGEQDLNQLGIEFNFTNGPGMCNHVRYKPMYFHSSPFRGESDPERQAFYTVTGLGSCTPSEDIDGDGQLDTGAYTDADNDGQCDYGEGTDHDVDCTPAEDLNGNGVLDTTWATMAPTYATDIDGLTLTTETGTSALCLSDLTDEGDDYFNCDPGAITLRTITVERVSDSDSRCNPSYLVEGGVVECGGNYESCLDGPIKNEGISNDDISKGVRTLVTPFTSSTGAEAETATFHVFGPQQFEYPTSNNMYISSYSVNHNNFFVSGNRNQDYTFDIRSYISQYADGYFGYNDPMSFGYPTYTFECLDPADEAIARIHVQVRDWDTDFNINSPIDSNFRWIDGLNGLTLTSAAAGANTMTLADATLITVGTKIMVGSDATTMGHKWQRYSVYNKVGNVIYVTPSLVKNHVTAGDEVRVAPITTEIPIADSGASKITETMDTLGIRNGVLGTYFNSKPDWDDYTSHSMIPDIGNYLTTGEIRSYLCADGTLVEAYTVDAISGNNLHLNAATPTGVALRPFYHCLSQDNGVTMYNIALRDGNTLGVDSFVIPVAVPLGRSFPLHNSRP